MDRFSLDQAETAGGDDVASQRGKPRDSLFLAAELTVGTLPAEHVRVRNLSAGGLMAEYPSPVAENEPVTIELRGIGRVAGRVAWATDGRVGIAFDRPIDPLRARKPVATKPAWDAPARAFKPIR